MPGIYKVSLSLTAGEETRQIAGPVAFKVVPLNNTTLPAPDRPAMVAFHAKVSELTRVMRGTEDYAEELMNRTTAILHALNSAPQAKPEDIQKARALYLELDEILNTKFNRRSTKPSSEENPPAPVSLNERLSKVTWITWSTTGQPTQGQMDAYKILEEEFPPVYNQVKRIGEVDLPALEKSLESIGAPVTPGRLPVWR